MVYSVWEEYELSEEKIEKMEVLTEWKGCDLHVERTQSDRKATLPREQL